MPEVKMIVNLVLLISVALCGGLRLPESEPSSYDPTAMEEPTGQDKVVSKRSPSPSYSVPHWGFIPLIAAPPVIQVHHTVHLQSPDRRCFPSPFPFPPTNDVTTSAPPTAGGDGLESRFGTNNETQTPAVKQPSPCVWAIVSCCSPGNANIRYACFELLGCVGAFWDLSPCEPRVVQAAANTALMFYMSAPPVNNRSNVIDFDVPEENAQ